MMMGNAWTGNDGDTEQKGWQCKQKIPKSRQDIYRAMS
jgi:hypothetical protein